MAMNNTTVYTPVSGSVVPPFNETDPYAFGYKAFGWSNMLSGPGRVSARSRMRRLTVSLPTRGATRPPTWSSTLGRTVPSTASSWSTGLRDRIAW